MIFLNSAGSAAALVFYLPGVCTHTDTEGKQRKARVRNILKYPEKTQYLINTLYHAKDKDIVVVLFEVRGIIHAPRFNEGFRCGAYNRITLT